MNIHKIHNQKMVQQAYVLKDWSMVSYIVFGLSPMTIYERIDFDNHNFIIIQTGENHGIILFKILFINK